MRNSRCFDVGGVLLAITVVSGFATLALAQDQAAEAFCRRIRHTRIRASRPEYLAPHQSAVPNSLTAVEHEQGWMLLFDGQTTNGWHGFRSREMLPGWQVRDGALVCGINFGAGPKGRTDIVTDKAFDDFELQFEWKTSPGGNSGVFFRVSEDAAAVYDLAPEFEIRDNAAWTDSPFPAGSNYALHVPACDVTQPVGRWNRSSILAKGDHVEHWMNGVKIVDYELFSDDWLDRLKRSGFGQYPKFARAPTGPIALQDYGYKVWFRDIKIRRIASVRGDPPEGRCGSHGTPRGLTPRRP